MTPAEVDARSAVRAARNRRRLRVLSLLGLGLLLSLAFLIQREQARLSDTLDLICEQRRSNAVRAVAFYDGMIAVELRDRATPADVREARLELFRAAKPDVPDCS